ncbi:MAG: ABC transporter substrate-binding protein [Candidatus ainarchaeum sp.]|nr:ABC transporter substrate-binding protein [Candidatus ainarchaeum sp.]
MRTKNFLIIVIIALALLFAGCTEQPKETKIKIGFMAPLTGSFADWGRSIQEGMQLALEDTNHKFNVDYQDDACDPKQGVTIINKFLGTGEINLIIGPGCIESLKAIAPIAEQNNILLFSTGLLDNEVFEKHKNIINLASQISTEGRYLASYLDSQKVKRVAIVYGTNPFGVEHSKTFPIFLKDYNIEVTSIEGSALDTTDFKTIILKVMNTNPEVIFIHQGEKQIGLFVKQLRELGYSTQVYGYYGTEAQSVIETGGEALEGMLYTYPVNSAENSPQKKEFERRYSEKFGKDKVPSATSFFVYDGMMLVDKAMAVCQSLDTECIKGFFEGRDYIGISGNMKFEKNGSITRPFGIKKIENGKFVWVTKKIE